MEQKQREQLRRARQQQRRKQVRRMRFLVAMGAAAVIFVIAFLALSVGSRLLSGRQITDPYALSAECESYREQVETEAAKYQMSSYVDLILAVMMQESSGRAVDVMQASEGKYNTKYPQKPNGITDSSYSIACGIQELKYALETAGCTGPEDFGRIEMALQAYNFGTDAYLPYMKEKNLDVWSQESAQAFAQMASGGKKRSGDLAENAGPWDYGDQYYPQHVLRYYPPYHELQSQ